MLFGFVCLEQLRKISSLLSL